jgi:hypothetical protein
MTREQTIATLHALEEERCRALLERDIPALQQLCSDQLRYTHTSTRREDKSTYVEAVASGFYQYLSFSCGPRTVTVIGGTALVHFHLITSAIVNGVPKTLDNEVLAVWILEDDRWRFAAYQPTPVPQPIQASSNP